MEDAKVAEIDSKIRRIFELAKIRVFSTSVQDLGLEGMYNNNPQFGYYDIESLDTLFLEFEIKETKEIIEVKTDNEEEFIRNLAISFKEDFKTGDLIAALHEQNKE